MTCFNWRVCAAALLSVILAAAAQAAAPVPGVSGTWALPPRPVWAGEVFDVTLSWHVDWDTFQNLDGPMTWSAAPFVAEEWQKPVLSHQPASGAKSWATIALQTRVMAVQPGRAVLQPAEQVMVLKTGTITMADYSRAVTKPLSVKSESAAVSVRALPPPPAGFSGAVGHFHIASTASATRVMVGDSITWTLTLSGTGNWPQSPGFPPRQVSQDLEVAAQPKTEELPGATLFQRTSRESVVLIARRPGHYVLGAVDMIQFDPALGQYVRISTAPLALDVKPNPAHVQGQDSSPAPSTQQASGTPLPAFLTGRGSAMAPMSTWLWWAMIAIQLVLVCTIWLALAFHRARKSDPDREARLAHARLGEILRLLDHAADEGERRRLVRRWQQETRSRWKLRRAAPLADAFSASEGWSRLWQEAETFLYGPQRPLPEDWIVRAERSRAELAEPPRFAPSSVLSRSNLLPAACVALFFFCLAFAVPAAAQLSAEEGWRSTVDAQPLAWKARHNLAVSLAAQQRWDEAAAQAAVSWIQHPSKETGRLWIMAAREAGYAAEADGGVPQPTGIFTMIAGLASPSVWRWIAAALISISSCAAVSVLIASYGHAPSRLKRIGFALLGAGAAGSIGACAMVAAYGFMGHREAVVVWRATPLRALPVETLPETVPQTALAGVQGRAEDRFLTWRRIRLRDGRSGWVREANLVWVWGHPSEQD